MLAETRAILDARGFVISPGIDREPGDYVIERAFVTHESPKAA